MLAVPSAFEANCGQVAAEIRYLARGRDSAFGLTDRGWVLRRSDGTTVRADFRGARPVKGRPEKPLAGRINSFIGAPSHWRTAIPTYGAVRYEHLYPRIDLRYYFAGRNVEYDFVVDPGGDPNRIAVSFDHGRPAVDSSGALAIDDQTRLLAPHAFQEIRGRRVERDARWIVEHGQARLRMGAWDRSQPLIIDPILEFGSYLGGKAAEYPGGIAVDAAGNVYVTGGTFSTDFPIAGGAQSANAGEENVFVSKLDPTGTTLIYSTFLGGAADDQSYALAIDAQGDAYVAGGTSSADFPVTPGAFLTTHPALNARGFTGFVAKLNAQGDTLLYSTFFGGSLANPVYGLAIDAAGSAYITGPTTSPDLPLQNALQSALRGVADGFVAKLDPAGSSLLYSTYLGGGAQDVPAAIALDPAGNVLVTGGTDSTDFPTVNAMQPVLRNGPVSKSTDGGQTWSISATGIAPVVQSKQSSPSTVQSLAIDPAVTSTLYAGTWSGIFKSADAGMTWQPKMNGLTSYEPVFTLAIDPTNTLTVYAGTQQDLFKTTDGGESWTVMDNGFNDRSFQVLAIDPRNPSTLYTATAFRLYKTVDGANSWTDLSASLPQNATVISLAVGPTLYAGIGISMRPPAKPGGGVYASTDGGQTWNPTALNDSPVNSVAVDPSDPMTLYAGSFFGGFMKSTDGGASWTVSVAGMAVQPVTQIRIDPADSTHLIVIAERGMYESHDAAGHWSRVSFVGPGVRALAIDPSNSAVRYVGTSVPPSAFLSKISADGSTLLWSTYFGGHVQELANAIAVDAAGSVYVDGFAVSPDLATAGAYQAKLHGSSDAFAAKFDAAGNLVYATYLGGTQYESAQGIWVDGAGNAWLTGNTGSGDFPTANAIQSSLAGEAGLDNDAFVAELDPAGANLLFSTYLGGAGQDQGERLAMDSSGALYVLGQTSSMDFPVTQGAFSTVMNNNAGAHDLSSDAFVVKLAPEQTGAPGISFAGLRNAANQISSGLIAPGEIVQITGTNLAASGTTVLVNGLAAQLVTLEAEQPPNGVEAVLPWELPDSGAVLLEVRRNGLRSNTLRLSMTPAVPGIFTRDGSGKGEAAAVNQDGTLNSPANPAPRGSVVGLFCTGGGRTDPPQADGVNSPAAAPVVADRVVASVGSIGATVQYAGAAPGEISGKLQVNVVIPDNAPVGGAVPVQIGIGNISSGEGATIAVK